MSPTLPLLADREAEKERFSRMMAAKPQTGKMVIPHAVLVKRYGYKVAQLRAALDYENVRDQANGVMRQLVADVTVNADSSGRVLLDVGASPATLIGFGSNEKTPVQWTRGFRVGWLRG